MPPILMTNGLKKNFLSKTGPIEAVKGVNLEVSQGEIFGFLGPNGAGKTTTLRMLSTLLSPDGGEACVAGYNLLTQSAKVRTCIGYVSQMGGSDKGTTAREDLLLQGCLYGMSQRRAKQRSYELLKTLNLESLADRKSATYSGGEKRRLDIALGMMHKPPLLFLDEPTTGLDPASRAQLWDEVKRLRDQGTTIFLTTHYMDEADELSDRIAIMDKGTIVVEGTPRSLKQQVAGDMVLLGLSEKEAALALFKDQEYVREASYQEGNLRLYVKEGEIVLPNILRLLDHSGIALRSVTLSQPTLDDVFLRQTGRSLLNN